MGVIIADRESILTFIIITKNKNYALLALLVFSLIFGFGFGLPAWIFVFFFSATDELALSSSAMAAGVESPATSRSESPLLFLRRLRLGSVGVSMMLSNCAAASEEPGTGADGVLRAI
jgi:hypothetical protein